MAAQADSVCAADAAPNGKICARAKGAGFARIAALSLALAACGPPERDEPPTVASVPNARTLVLTTGDEVILAGLQPPRPAEGRASAEPFFTEARAALEALALGRALDLAPSDPEYRDRWDRRIAQAAVTGPDGRVWLQGRLLELGLARVSPDTASRGRADEMLALEEAARRAERGLWSSPYYAVRAPDATRPAIGSFQIVEGVVVDAAESRGRVFLNFGPDYRTDFTATVAPERREAFAGADLLALSGARVRVRGWLTRLNGPNLELTEPAQLERLDAR
ncbi:MAG: thermonuclease family protein [Caulobacterales bacterium]|nr:thermonuclease family protein [Caulobacterales bacterium]